jgi:hypothetical protein
VITAAGGALDDAGFVVNILVAIGTLLAAGIALWLGLYAQAEGTRREKTSEQHQRRQIIAVLNRTPNRQQGQPWATLDMVNGSDHVISEVRYQLRYPPHDYGTWMVTGGQTLPTFMLPQTSHRVTGSFHEMGPNGLRTDTFVNPENVTVQSIFWWRDARGDFWARVDGGEPFRTSGAVPGRIIPDTWSPTPETLGQRIRRKLGLATS